MIEVRDVTEYECLAALVPAWRRLWECDPRATPFQHPAWLLPWWHAFGAGQLHSVALFAYGELVGLAPLFVRDGRLQFIGTGNTDYLDVLCAPGWQTRGGECFRNHLHRSGGWEVADYQEMRTDSPWLACHRQDAVAQSVCPTLDLSGFRLNSKRRNTFRRRSRQLWTSGDVCFEVASGEQSEEYLEALLRLHALRWQTRGETGVLVWNEVQRFHRECCPALAAAGCLRFLGLRLNGELIAVLYWLQKPGVVFAYLTGFDPQFAAHGPGMLLQSCALEHAVFLGDSECHFLRGGEPYKYEWGASDRINYCVTVLR